MSASAGCQLLGKWRIIEADTWDCDYLDLVQPAYIVFSKNGRGEFAFGAIDATLELEYAPRIVFFNWTGFDEGDEVSGSGSAELIPSPNDHDLCAHWRFPIDMIIQGRSTSLFQASQQWARMSSEVSNTRVDHQLSRMYCQTFSTGLSSGERGGSGTMVILSGTSSLAVRGHPARSASTNAWDARGQI